MTAPATATEVALHLAKLSRQLAETVDALEAADRHAVEARGGADLAFSRAFVSETGAVDHYKHLAVIATHDQRLAADVADAVVRHLRRRIDALKTQIDVGRSYGAAVRAEINLANSGMDT